MGMAPKSPREQRSSGDHDAPPVADAGQPERRDGETGAQSADPGDADVNLGQQGRYGDLKQNLTNHWKVQER